MKKQPEIQCVYASEEKSLEELVIETFQNYLRCVMIEETDGTMGPV